MSGPSLVSNIFRRAFDIAFSGLFLLFALPVFVVIAAAIYFETGRPIFFAHRRLGLGGRPFYVYKFRKFHKDCSSDGSQLTFKKDARFTRVGQFLASCKLDELPQFWNILIGDMSLVGPRPESLVYADCFADEFEHVLDYKPGLFGPSQVKFRNENALYPESGDFDKFYRQVIFPAKANIDLAYYAKRTFVSDWIWIVRSVGATLNVGGGLDPNLFSETRSQVGVANNSTPLASDE